MEIHINKVTKRFNTFTALAAVDLEIRSGELVALLGPSGSGKTTLLRIIAGLEWPDDGQVFFDGEDALRRSVRERNVGFVFQHYALFRHLTVFENVAFGLRVRPRGQRLPEADIRNRVEQFLSLVQLQPLAGRYPTQLSGGQRQRVALARALAVNPRVLLLDEPFGALDAKVRKELRRWLRHLHEEIHVTSVFVTHDQEEALEVADRIVVMDKGKIQQIGTPEDVYERPETAFVHEFIGESIVLPVHVENGLARFDGCSVELDAQGAHDGRASLFARPSEVAIGPPADALLSGIVKRVHGLGPSRRVEVALGNSGTAIEVDASHDCRFDPGERVSLRPSRYRIFGAKP
jgi:sulfate transport system ATP-binding protein